VIVGANTFWIDVAILVSIVIPIGAFCVFAVWFLRQKDE
jgi:hypothetical protein